MVLGCHGGPMKDKYMPRVQHCSLRVVLQVFLYRRGSQGKEGGYLQQDFE